jgi:hypothetical protein
MRERHQHVLSRRPTLGEGVQLSLIGVFALLYVLRRNSARGGGSPKEGAGFGAVLAEVAHRQRRRW